MLVLTRKVGQVITVGDNIRITVAEIRGDKVRLGIAAPENVIVDREEIHEKRKKSLGEWPFTPTPTGVFNDYPLMAKSGIAMKRTLQESEKELQALAVLTMAEDSTDSSKVGFMREELQMALSLAQCAAEPDTYSSKHRERAVGEAQKVYDGVLIELKKVAILSPEDELWIGQELEELRRKLKALSIKPQRQRRRKLLRMPGSPESRSTSLGT